MEKKYVIVCILMPIILILLVIFKPFGLKNDTSKKIEQGKLGDSQGHFTENLAEYTNTLSPEEEEENRVNPVIINNIDVLYDYDIDIKYLATLGKYYEIVHRELYGENGKQPWTIIIDPNTIKENNHFLHFDTYITELDNMKIHVGYSYETGGFELTYDELKNLSDNPNVNIK